VLASGTKTQTYLRNIIDVHRECEFRGTVRPACPNPEEERMWVTPITSTSIHQSEEREQKSPDKEEQDAQ